MTETLKPCPNPWCNPTMSPITISERDAKGKFTLLAKRCFQCGVQSSSETTLDKAITAWNTRAPDDVAQIVTWLRKQSSTGAFFADANERGDWKDRDNG